MTQASGLFYSDLIRFARSSTISFMEILGRIHNGVVVLEGNPPLPEGAVVAVTYPVPEAPALVEKRRVEFPLVRGGTPGTWNLTSEQIAEILDEEDIATVKGMWDVPS
jgi:hypothetical protein